VDAELMAVAMHTLMQQVGQRMSTEARFGAPADEVGVRE